MGAGGGTAAGRVGATGGHTFIAEAMGAGAVAGVGWQTSIGEACGGVADDTSMGHVAGAVVGSGFAASGLAGAAFACSTCSKESCETSESLLSRYVSLLFLQNKSLLFDERRKQLRQWARSLLGRPPPEQLPLRAERAGDDGDDSRGA
ncbi:hypothetical protein AK812_SmicGene2187 [Symbiodinium microadriaticum]|uniref:Uncharacterized protein n=1 Tax=Symbiodinium microadriaticum TaxID=2951 RepID=A0A1Q9F260_SYMMI|nr:hypothetical protein AK812_SmicGene2187 [Symbiodinium microadriaticum]